MFDLTQIDKFISPPVCAFCFVLSSFLSLANISGIFMQNSTISANFLNRNIYGEMRLFFNSIFVVVVDAVVAADEIVRECICSFWSKCKFSETKYENETEIETENRNNRKRNRVSSINCPKIATGFFSFLLFFFLVFECHCPMGLIFV